MPTPVLSLVPVLLALALAACSPQPDDGDPSAAITVASDSAALGTAAPPAVAEPVAPAPAARDAMTDPCDAAAVQSLVGQEATADVVEQARIDAGARTARTLGPDQMVTMEFLEGRLNIDVDGNNVITGLRCG